ncbi:MAG TPA: hypothetical protein VKA68_03655 [bacterium]|nr:hypothetical protein [bacterium]
MQTYMAAHLISPDVLVDDFILLPLECVCQPGSLEKPPVLDMDKSIYVFDLSVHTIHQDAAAIR